MVLANQNPSPSSVTRAFLEEFEYVYRYFRRRGVPPAEAEDLAQDVFVVVCRRWTDFQPDRPLRPWLAGIAQRMAMDHARRHRRRELTSPELVQQEDAEPGPDDRLAAARARQLALRALAALPDRHRAVLVRHELEGVSLRKIAKEWSLPFFTVAARVRRARVRFEKAVKQLQLGGSKRGAWLPAQLALTVIGAATLAASLVAVVALGADRTTASRSPGPGLSRGLVAHWAFEEGPGSRRAADATGNGHHCLVHDLDLRAASVPGRVGRALDLGATGWLECPLPELRPGVPFSVSVAAWIKREPKKDKRDSVLFTRALEGAGPGHLFWFGLRADLLAVWSWQWQGWTTGLLPPLGGWSHVAFVHGQNETTLYIDGVLVRHKTGQLPRSEGAVQTALTIGGSRHPTEPGRSRHHFDGVIDEAMIYDRALGATEIAALAARGR